MALSPSPWNMVFSLVTMTVAGSMIQGFIKVIPICLTCLWRCITIGRSYTTMSVIGMGLKIMFLGVLVMVYVVWLEPGLSPRNQLTMGKRGLESLQGTLSWNLSKEPQGSTNKTI
ncbi:Hypothetical predicted protein [Olea europaea subsp. europaea]|uniref:Uncharacterized protein n=1 Tax=Olea europaea subsp. europaea TaxID=158383 RepID=A0A8S0S6D4_OLEEU|nr:Hypothetical predicted protein [Olea europaea subsp. europaea]